MTSLQKIIISLVFIFPKENIFSEGKVENIAEVEKQ